MKKTPASPFSARFVRDLNRVSGTLAPSLEIEDFLSDLDRLHRHSAPNFGFDKLANVFDGLITDAVAKLGGPTWYEDLPPYDPLRGRISLFGTLDWGLRETAHTRALAWFLNPDGNHGFGDILLRAFLKQIFGLRGDPVLSQCDIKSEFLSGDSSRDRLDISMKGEWTLAGSQETWMAIVEAKIGADEREDQCARYEARGKKIAADNLAFVFLTPEGHPPTTGSNPKQVLWKPFPFIKLMALFRKCLPELRNNAGHEFLRLYMTGVLKDIYQLDCGQITERDDLYCISDYLIPENDGSVK